MYYEEAKLMNFRKRIISVFLSGALMLCGTATVGLYLSTDDSVIGTTVNAAEYQNYIYEENNNGITITKYKGNEKNLTIPKTINGKQVTTIGSGAFAECNSLSSVTVPDGVTSIEGKEGAYSMGAFYGCMSLTSVKLPDTLTNIGPNAFYGCVFLQKITLPDSVRTIGTDALGYFLYEDPTESMYDKYDLIVVGNNDTAAEKYARDNNFEFELAEDKPQVILGDVTGDSVLDIADALLIARADALLTTLTDEQREAADVNFDGTADIADALLIARIDSGLSSI